MRVRRTNIIRVAILIIFIAAITFESFQHQVRGGGPDGSPSIHALCPYGGLESLYSLFTSGSAIDKIYAGTISLFIISVILALVLRRGFCGWICPFGGLQELFGMLGKKVLKKRLVMPLLADKYLRYLKYLVLVLTAVMAWATASLWVSPYDPWAAYGHLSEGLSSVWSEFTVGVILLAVTFIGSFFYDRFFCKYLCPMGAFLGILGKMGLVKIARDPETCIDCNLCTKVCPVNIDVAKVDYVRSAECINCQQCVESCPKKGALENRVRFVSGFTPKPLLIGAVVLVIYFGGFGISALAGSSNLVPAPVSEDTQTITDPDQLKGYMTLEDIATVMGKSLDEVYKAMGVPEHTPKDVPVKELGDIVPGFDFHASKEGLRQ